MTNRRSRTGNPRPHELPHYQALLDDTDWASLATACGTGEALPTAPASILNPDPAVRAAATDNALRQVTHQNTLYGATVPVALFVAAILDHPAIATVDFGRDADTPPHHPTLVRLLEWLSDTAYDADDECAAISERHVSEGFFQEDREMRAFRDLRPAIFSAVHALLGHDNTDVHHAALVAAIPLAEHPAITAHRAELADHVRCLLATSTDRHNRDRVLDAMKAWGHDIPDLENADDIAARQRYARLKAERESWWAADGTGGYSEDRRSDSEARSAAGIRRSPGVAEGATVRFGAPSQGPTGTFPSGTTSETLRAATDTIDVTTGADGTARTYFAAGGSTGTCVITAVVPGLPTASGTYPVTITVFATGQSKKVTAVTDEEGRANAGIFSGRTASTKNPSEQQSPVELQAAVAGSSVPAAVFTLTYLTRWN